MAERIGVFGGTFDPPHIGHLVAAVNVRHALALDRVLLVVANDPWQKTGQRVISPAQDRLAMVAAATAGVDGLECSDVEIRRGGASYTIDTLSELAAGHPGAELFLVLGRDAAAGLPTWERGELVPSLATIVVVDRPGVAEELPVGLEVERLDIPLIDLSSTELRERVVDGRPLDFLVPPGVVSVIHERRLYGDGR